MRAWLASLPTAWCVAALICTTVAMVLLSLSTHGKVREGWGNLLLLVACVCLAMAFWEAS